MTPFFPLSEQATTPVFVAGWMLAIVSPRRRCALSLDVRGGARMLNGGVPVLGSNGRNS
jgi:hypothetical protein